MSDLSGFNLNLFNHLKNENSKKKSDDKGDKKETDNDTKTTETSNDSFLNSMDTFESVTKKNKDDDSSIFNFKENAAGGADNDDKDTMSLDEFTSTLRKTYDDKQLSAEDIQNFFDLVNSDDNDDNVITEDEWNAFFGDSNNDGKITNKEFANVFDGYDKSAVKSALEKEEKAEETKDKYTFVMPDGATTETKNGKEIIRDKDGKLYATKETKDDKTLVIKEYDKDGNVKKARVEMPEGSDEQSYTVDYEYNGDIKVKSTKTYDDNTVHVREFDSKTGKPTHSTEESGDGKTQKEWNYKDGLVDNFSVTRDGVKSDYTYKHEIKEDKTRETVRTKVGDDTKTLTRFYDEKDHKTKAVENDTATGTIKTWEYDENGNKKLFKKETKDGTVTINYDKDGNKLLYTETTKDNKVTSYKYDEKGNKVLIDGEEAAKLLKTVSEDVNEPSDDKDSDDVDNAGKGGATTDTPAADDKKAATDDAAPVEGTDTKVPAPVSDSTVVSEAQNDAVPVETVEISDNNRDANGVLKNLPECFENNPDIHVEMVNGEPQYYINVDTWVENSHVDDINCDVRLLSNVYGVDYDSSEGSELHKSLIDNNKSIARTWNGNNTLFLNSAGTRINLVVTDNKAPRVKTHKSSGDGDGGVPVPDTTTPVSTTEVPADASAQENATDTQNSNEDAKDVKSVTQSKNVSDADIQLQYDAMGNVQSVIITKTSEKSGTVSVETSLRSDGKQIVKTKTDKNGKEDGDTSAKYFGNKEALSGAGDLDGKNGVTEDEIYNTTYNSPDGVGTLIDRDTNGNIIGITEQIYSSNGMSGVYSKTTFTDGKPETKYYTMSGGHVSEIDRANYNDIKASMIETNTAPAEDTKKVANENQINGDSVADLYARYINGEQVDLSDVKMHMDNFTQSDWVTLMSTDSFNIDSFVNFANNNNTDYFNKMVDAFAQDIKGSDNSKTIGLLYNQDTFQNASFKQAIDDLIKNDPDFKNALATKTQWEPSSMEIDILPMLEIVDRKANANDTDQMLVLLNSIFRNNTEIYYNYEDKLDILEYAVKKLPDTKNKLISDNDSAIVKEFLSPDLVSGDETNKMKYVSRYARIVGRELNVSDENMEKFLAEYTKLYKSADPKQKEQLNQIMSVSNVLANSKDSSEVFNMLKDGLSSYKNDYIKPSDESMYNIVINESYNTTESLLSFYDGGYRGSQLTMACLLERNGNNIDSLISYVQDKCSDKIGVLAKLFNDLQTQK